VVTVLCPFAFAFLHHPSPAQDYIGYHDNQEQTIIGLTDCAGDMEQSANDAVSMDVLKELKRKLDYNLIALLE